MTEKKFRNGADKQVNFVILVSVVSVVCLFLMMFLFGGCASQTGQMPQMDSNHYVAQAQPQGYPCPECGFPIPDKNVSPNIRTENKCPNCGKIFFGVPVAKKSQEREQTVSYGLRSHGPRSIYESDTNYQSFWVGGESFKETSTGYSFLSWRFRDSKVKSRRVIPHWTTRRYSY